MRKRLRQTAYLAAIAVCSAAMASNIQPGVHAASSVAPEMKKMDIWVGRWQSQTEVRATPYSQAAQLSSEMTCSWSPNHGFILCDHLMHGEDGTTNSLSVYTYDDTDKTYKFFGVEKDSSPREVPMEVKGNVWSFGTEVQNQDKTIMFLTNDEFLSHTRMRFTTMFSDDNGKHWSVLNQGELTKVG